MSATMKKCPLCAEEIELAVETCPYCGARFQITAQGYCTECHTMRDTDAGGKCPVCGTPMADLRVTSRFVGEEAPAPAGPTTGDQRPTLEAAAQPARKIPAWVWVLIAVAVVAIIGGAALWLGAPQVASLSASPTPLPTPVPTNTPRPTSRPGATATPTPARITAFTGPILSAIANRPPDFEDDFSTREGRWERWPDQSSGVTFESGVMRLTVTGGWTGAGGSLNAEDFALQFEFTPVTIPDVGDVDVHWRVTDGSSFYSFGINPFNHYWSLAQMLNGDWQEVQHGYLISLRAGQVTRVLVLARGSEMAVYLNDEPLLYWLNTAITGNYQDLSVWSETDTITADFDNVKFWDLSGVPGLP